MNHVQFAFVFHSINVIEIDLISIDQLPPEDLLGSLSLEHLLKSMSSYQCLDTLQIGRELTLFIYPELLNTVRRVS